MDYSNLTLEQLKSLATERKIAGRSKATRKDQVIHLLESWDAIQGLEDDGLTGEYGVSEVSEEEIQAAKELQELETLETEISTDESVRKAAIAASNCVVEVTELGYASRGIFQVFRGDPNRKPANLIPVGAKFQVIRFYGNDIKIDFHGADVMIHEDYLSFHFSSKDVSEAAA